jgi:hypothetical protein
MDEIGKSYVRQFQDGASVFAHEINAYMTREKSGWKERVHNNYNPSLYDKRPST